MEREHMCKKNKINKIINTMNNTKSDNGANVTVSVDVTKIVKYVAIAGIAIVGIIFGCKAWTDVERQRTARFDIQEKENEEE